MSNFPYSQAPHKFAGSDSERQSVGDPGHCEDCCSVGHVKAHPDLGCGDVGCDLSHDEPEPMKAGAIGRTVRSSVDLTTLQATVQRTIREDARFEIESYISAEDSEDGEAFYWVVSLEDGISTYALRATDIEQVMDKAAARARKIPSPVEVMREISSSLLGSFDTFSVEEITRDSAGAAEVYGRTFDGLPFGYRIQIQGTWKTDF